MFHRLLALLAAPVLAAAGLIAAPAVALAGDPCYHGFDLPTRIDEATTQIKLAPCAFVPTVARVAAGTTVTFFNGPEFVHLITGANQAWGSRDVEVAPNTTVSYRFDAPGIYPYACALHRGMVGAIVVGDGGAAAAAVGATADPGTPDEKSGGGALVGAGAFGLLAGLAILVGLRRRPAGAMRGGSGGAAVGEDAPA